MWQSEKIRILERIRRPRGELVLRARDVNESDGSRKTVYEIISNGVFLIDSRESRTEKALGYLGLEPLGDRRNLRVLVGGLGLGYTLASVLETPEVAVVTVVELEEAIFRWVAGPLRMLAQDPLSDPRVVRVVADIVPYMKERAEIFDTILLDVDNGPDFTVHSSNHWLYEKTGLRAIKARLSSGGVLTTWSSSEAPALLEAMRVVFGRVEEHWIPTTRENHRFDYYLYRATNTG